MEELDLHSKAKIRAASLGVRDSWARYAVDEDSAVRTFRCEASPYVQPHLKNCLTSIEYSNRLFVDNRRREPVAVSALEINQALATSFVSDVRDDLFHFPAEIRLMATATEQMRLESDECQGIAGLHESLQVMILNEELIAYRIPDECTDAENIRGRVIRRFYPNPMRIMQAISRCQLSTDLRYESYDRQVRMFFGLTGQRQNTADGNLTKIDEIFFGQMKPVGDRQSGYMIFMSAQLFRQLWSTFILRLTGQAFECELEYYGLVIPRLRSGKDK